MEMDTVRELAELMKAYGLNVVCLEDGGSKVVLKKGGTGAVLQAMPPPVPAAPMAVPAAVLAAAPSAGAKASAVGATGRQVKAPLVGTFYRSSSPESDPFVKVGDRVGADTVVCIIEAMKVMNEVKAGVSGTVRKVLVENGAAVEYGQALLEVDEG